MDEKQAKLYIDVLHDRIQLAWDAVGFLDKIYFNPDYKEFPGHLHVFSRLFGDFLYQCLHTTSIVSMSRFMDPAKSFKGDENISLKNLIGFASNQDPSQQLLFALWWEDAGKPCERDPVSGKARPCTPTKEDLQKAEGIYKSKIADISDDYKALSAKFEDLKKLRDKTISHSDVGVLVKNEELPKLPFREVKTILGEMTDLLDKVLWLSHFAGIVVEKKSGEQFADELLRLVRRDSESRDMAYFMANGEDVSPSDSVKYILEYNSPQKSEQVAGVLASARKLIEERVRAAESGA